MIVNPTPAPRPPQPGQPTPPPAQRVPQKPPERAADKILDPNRNGTFKEVHPPERNRQGQPITQQPLQNANGRVIAPTTNNVTIINNNTYITNINNVQNNWNGRRDYGYQWHHWDGREVCHHYDPYGYHWWGFYVGPVYFWTRYWDDNYWWYDPYWHRWVYLHDSRWWWRDPYNTEVVYVYTDNGYYRYDDAPGGGGVVMNPDPTPPVVMPPDPEPTPVAQQPIVYTSADGTRIVTISADGKKTAYLSDTADPPAFQPVWLGDGVTEVRFKLDEQGALSQILTITDDGGFSVFDRNGYAINNQPPATEPTSLTSPDGSRTVTISGDGTGTATLSDTADPPAFAPFVLTTGATDAKFKLDDQGNLTEIAVILADGGFLVFDRNGLSLTTPTPVDPLPSPETPAPAPDRPLGQPLMKSAAFSSLRGALGW